ncbi:hypothetical protein ACFV2Q_33965 [Streptomyces sp. NPDC059650]|uniref:hypothetical protein n=1 Tax=Streptomyces sp. NPDC059650 TaxID=3346896 RepID=UPI003694B0BA
MEQVMATKMRCINCGAEMYAGGICESCDWRQGWLPVAQASGGSTTFVAEQRHGFIATSIFLATLVGLIGFVAGIASGSAGGAFFGLLVAVAGVAAWVKTHMGRLWIGLAPGDKAAAWPGVLAGGFIAIVAIPITLFCIAILKAATPQVR